MPVYPAALHHHPRLLLPHAEQPPPLLHLQHPHHCARLETHASNEPRHTVTAQQNIMICLGLFLDTEAPVMMPTVVDFSLLLHSFFRDMLLWYQAGAN